MFLRRRGKEHKITFIYKTSKEIELILRTANSFPYTENKQDYDDNNIMIWSY